MPLVTSSLVGAQPPDLSVCCSFHSNLSSHHAEVRLVGCKVATDALHQRPVAFATALEEDDAAHRGASFAVSSSLRPPACRSARACDAPLVGADSAVAASPPRLAPSSCSASSLLSGASPASHASSCLFLPPRLRPARSLAWCPSWPRMFPLSSLSWPVNLGP